MIFISINGREQKMRNPTKYLIDWDKKCRSKIQKEVKDLIRDFWISDVVFEEFPVLGSKMTFDFYNANKKIALEVDGNQHYKYNKFFHNNNRMKFLDQLKRDQKKEDFCKINKIKLARILESDILNKELLASLNII